MNVSDLKCKVADTPGEIEQIHQLNYRTFVEEIPQHLPNPERRLVDKFHHENTYLVIKDGDRLVGMFAMRDKRPFSLDGKLESLDTFLPPCEHPVEARLLAVEPEYRSGPVLRMLMDNAFEQAAIHDWDLVVISATTRQLGLYRHLGFEPFGPIVGTGDALFQPMFVRPKRVGTVLKSLAEIARKENTPSALRRKIISLLPGPVTVSPRVLTAMSVQPFSHRSALFHDMLDEARRGVCRLTQTDHCQIFPGSGTLANDMVSQQLARLGTPGVVLVNGEFGQRLAGQVRRAGMQHTTLDVEWGQEFELKAIHNALASLPVGGWVWWVHHETSTGIINPLREIIDMARARKLIPAVDAISSIGNIPVDLAGAEFATAVSGKGLCGYPGLGIVFHHEANISLCPNVPSYLDLGFWIAQNGVGFTHSSNLIAALATSLAEQDFSERFKTIAWRDAWLRNALKDSRFQILTHGASACPAVLTLIPRDGPNAWQTGLALEETGFVLSYRSNYLRERNWLQISLMSLPSAEDLATLVRALNQKHPTQAESKDLPKQNR
ncbi:MAG: aminotransferase class V-fold PLP-dependent enzyme [Puniceicoccales bacterium]|jgi:aspartate aminotransferase-like enzyme/GNAT superfamily N-acetyltransferase|nr:aminotransferase class V-fold PLP-dependent enzyme [Puniceicoccales bacterium]